MIIWIYDDVAIKQLLQNVNENISVIIEFDYTRFNSLILEIILDHSINIDLKMEFILDWALFV